MPRWITRALWAAALGAALPAAAPAQQPMPDPAAPPPAAEALPNPPAAPAHVVAPVHGGIVVDPYRAATPYNATVVGRSVPNAAYNRPNFTLPCDIPNQNLDSLQYPTHPGAHFLRYTRKDGCNDGGGTGFGWLRSKFSGACCGDGGGSCATCCNAHNMMWGSSRAFFGESSREFFERPPAVDALKHPYIAAKRGVIPSVPH